jgi:hypothetical protein
MAISAESFAKPGGKQAFRFERIGLDKPWASATKNQLSKNNLKEHSNGNQRG